MLVVDKNVILIMKLNENLKKKKKTYQFNCYENTFLKFFFLNFSFFLHFFGEVPMFLVVFVLFLVYLNFFQFGS